MCPVSDTGLCCGRNTREAACFPTATTGKHQAAACQCVCEFFYTHPFACYGNRLELVDVTLCSEKPLIKGVSGSDSVFMGISVTQPIAITICGAFGSMRDKCRFSAPR